MKLKKEKKETKKSGKTKKNRRNESTEPIDANTQAQQEDKDKDDLTKEEELSLALAEAKDKQLRLLAEFENYRKRMGKEQLKQAQECAGKTLEKLLPVVDDFHRAKLLADEGKEAPFSEGLSIAYHKLFSTLEGMGLTMMESTGQAFDTDLHEAVTEIPVDEAQKGKVVDTIENGYLIKDSVLRFAKVVVGK